MHDVKDVLDKQLIARINDDLEQFAVKWQQDSTVGSPEPVQAFCDVMLRGGKRLRGMLAMQSYFAHGGTDEAVALAAARVFEIIQTSLLIVDDIADRSRLRRGGPSAHIVLEEYARKNNLKGSASHYGEVQTMNAAYAGLHKATTELLALPVSSDIARRACSSFHENILVTINGQVDDIYNEATREPVTKADIESVMERKTAYYSFLSPLELGAQLAGAPALAPGLRVFSIHAGSAFQIVDDIIGTFGNESDTGKGTNDDIIEGKLTLLLYFAKLQATDGQNKKLLRTLGNEDATAEDCDDVRRIFEQTGALEYAKEQLHLHEQKALQALDSDKSINPQFVDYLRRLGAYLLSRTA
jgi:geranylgeranyl diphosphate synthase, type II